MGTDRCDRIKIVVCVFGGLILYGCSAAVAASPKPVENAALLYYQACLGLEHPDYRRPEAILRSLDVQGRDRAELEEATRLYRHGFWQGECSDANVPEVHLQWLDGEDRERAIKEFLDRADCRLAVEQIMAATRMPHCDWGLWVSGRWFPGRLVAKSQRRLVLFLWEYTRVLVAGGRYGEAIEAIAAFQRFSCHTGDETYVMWIMSSTAQSQAFGLAHRLLSTMPPDVEMLGRLESALAETKGPGWHPRQTLTKWGDMMLASRQASIDRHSNWQEAFIALLAEDFPDWESGKAEGIIEHMAGPQQVLDLARQAHRRFVDSAIEILESDAAYHAKHKQVVQLVEEFIAGAEAGDVSAFVVNVGSVEPYYRFHINGLAMAHAVKAAIAIYRIKATTGQLPASLPADLPKDPYSGRDFEYQVTDGGFRLTCRAPAIDWGVDDNPRQFDFKIVK